MDLRHLSEAERDFQADRLAQMEAEKRFNMSRGPLIRASLQRLGEEEHVLLITLHEAIADECSVGILAAELAAIYEALPCRSKPRWAELPRQYSDFVFFQRGRLQEHPFGSQLAYWKRQLGNLSPLDLPTDKPRRAVRSLHSERHSVLLPRSLTNPLADYGDHEGCTLPMTMLAVLKVLLSPTIAFISTESAAFSASAPPAWFAV